jgi:hypothetical protein
MEFVLQLKKEMLPSAQQGAVDEPHLLFVPEADGAGPRRGAD